MDGVAHTHNVIDQGAVGNAKVKVKVGKHIVKSVISEQKETEEASGDVDSGAKCE